MKPEDIELPEPSFWVAAPPRAGLVLTETKPSEWGDSHPLYTADQVRGAIEKAVAQERERCAKVAEDADVPTFRHGGRDYDDGVQMQANIAAAIRSMK